LGGSGTPDEVVERIAKDLALTDDVQNELLSSGEPRFRNQVAWARYYLVREGPIDSSKRGVWSLTERGRSARLSPQQSREIFLKWVRIFQEQRRAKATKPQPPEEAAAEGAEATTNDYRIAILNLLLQLPPNGFERLAQRILREAGFTQVVVTGSSGDGGIDGYGTLQVNPLVSFKVLFQCKRYTKSVSPAHVRDFRGAMSGRADKGIINTALNTVCARSLPMKSIRPSSTNLRAKISIKVDKWGSATQLALSRRVPLTMETRLT